MRTVFIVDDDDGFRETLSTVLMLEGFQVEATCNGRECLQLLARSAPPDAVLMDLMMPVMSGWELIRAMKDDPALAAIPAAVVSAARNPRDIPPSVTVFRKPCQLQDLLQFLNRPAP